MADAPLRRHHPAAPLDRADVLAALGADGATRPVTVTPTQGQPGARCGTSARSAMAAAIRWPSASPPWRPRAGPFPGPRAWQEVELDWAATQAGIDLLAAGGGGTLLSPAGTYRCNRTLTFPECREFGARGAEVNWLGEGKYTTTYHWPQDLGPGGFAVLCPRREEADGMYEGVWQDLGLLGPRAGGARAGGEPGADGWLGLRGDGGGWSAAPPAASGPG